MLAVVPVRGGEVCVGGLEAIAEAEGAVLLIGSGAAQAGELLGAVATSPVLAIEAASFAPAAWAVHLAGVIAQRFSDVSTVIVPASPDGRDLAPRLAASLGWGFVAAALEVSGESVRVERWGGRVTVDVTLTGAAVVTLQPGAVGDPSIGGSAPSIDSADLPAEPSSVDPIVVEVTPPDVTTMDLSEAPRIVGGGAGLGSEGSFGALTELATRLGASMGATRVVTDAGWVPHERQIGTTGVVVDPRLYLAFGISGAVQHTAGLGGPEHIISVNTDPHCPMMAMADLAVVSDAPAVVDALLARLEEGAVDG